MSGKSYKQKQVSKKEQKFTPSTSSGKGKQSINNTKELQNEIEKLRQTIVIYRNNLDPATIRAELDLTDQSMINILTDENFRLTEELHKYNSTDTRER
ncbi:uncharacterized protein LOC132749288 isoform X2 [Ruditapes philippinarum]|uniref:uncharacterized protein LOC132749288 isoform X2 n=1 Tax=Ruditapes philippinarum TaxID=129788 RepID=UPI00295BA418|nr:uncharacterized protein LOC132749288 isoform X2 [Ruditapes philippinarum]